MSRTLTRRALVAGAGAALGAATLPAVVGAAPSAIFDAAGFVADLRAIGCVVYPWTGRSGRPAYGMMSAEGFGEDFRAVVQRWNDAVEACPDHAGRVAAYLAGEKG